MVTPGRRERAVHILEPIHAVVKHVRPVRALVLQLPKSRQDFRVGSWSVGSSGYGEVGLRQPLREVGVTVDGRRARVRTRPGGLGTVRSTRNVTDQRVLDHLSYSPSCDFTH